MSQRLRIQTFVLGDWMTNCYVVAPPVDHALASRHPCWIIDAGFSPGPMIQYIREHDLEPVQVILTHGHLDHIAGLDAIRAAWPHLPVLIHKEEEQFLTEPQLNLSAFIDEPISVAPATGLIETGQKFTLGSLEFIALHTPGHSPGGIALYQKDTGVALVGDTLFAGSVGRTDFPTSDPAALLNSIRTQLLTLPDTTRIFPGHGPSTTIGQEKINNPYIQPR